MTSHLHTRIAEAFAKPLPSGDLAVLLVEVAAAEQNARDVSTTATERALDPSTPPADVAEARRQKEDAEFSLQRMATATPRLRDLLNETQDRERKAATAKARQAALAERDALAKELVEFYPPMAAKLADLLNRIAANDAKLLRGEGAEDITRGGPATWRTHPAGNMPSLVHGVRLPEFNLDVHGTGYLYCGDRGASR